MIARLATLFSPLQAIVLLLAGCSAWCPAAHRQGCLAAEAEAATVKKILELWSKPRRLVGSAIRHCQRERPFSDLRQYGSWTPSFTARVSLRRSGKETHAEPTLLSTGVAMRAPQHACAFTRHRTLVHFTNPYRPTMPPCVPATASCG